MDPPTIDEYRLRLADYAGQRGGSGKCIDGSTITTDSHPVLSVITTAWNSVQTVSDTIQSVLSQAFRKIEYVVIDGGSTDGTVDVIRRHEAQIAYWHSGKDLGISDAFNLGIAASRGQYVAIVNSDDWMTREQAQIAVTALNKSDAAFCFGDAQIYNVDGKLRYRVAGDPSYFLCDWCRMPDINHPSVVVRRKSYAAVGLFDTRLKIAMDFDWHLRAELAGFRGVYVPDLYANMRLGGVCDAGGNAAFVKSACRQSSMASQQGWLIVFIERE